METKDTNIREFETKRDAHRRSTQAKTLDAACVGAAIASSRNECVGAAIASSRNECAETDAPWRMLNHEANQRGFHNGVDLAQKAYLLEMLISCLEKMNKFQEMTLTNREDALARTHLEDCIMRVERSLKQTEKNLGISG